MYHFPRTVRFLVAATRKKDFSAADFINNKLKLTEMLGRLRKKQLNINDERQLNRTKHGAQIHKKTRGTNETN